MQSLDVIHVSKTANPTFFLFFIIAHFKKDDFELINKSDMLKIESIFVEFQKIFIKFFKARNNHIDNIMTEKDL